MSTQKSRLSSGDSLYEYLKMVEETGTNSSDKVKVDTAIERARRGVSVPTEPLFDTSGDVGSITPVEPTLRSNVEQGVANLLGTTGMGTERSNLQQAQKLTMLGDYLPGTGTTLAAADFEDARREGSVPGMLLGGIGMIPFGKPVADAARSVGNVINRTAQNVPTLIPRFYEGNPFVSAKNFSKEYLKAIPSTVRESTDAASRAKRRVYGISDRKLDEALTPKTGKDADLTAISINRQLPNQQRTLIDESVIGLNYLDNGVARSDVDTIAANVGNKFRAEGAEQVPESLINRATRHLTDGPHVTDKKGVYEYQFKDPASRSNEGYLEAVGANKAGSTAMRSLHTKQTDVYLDDLNKVRGTDAKELSPTDMVEFLQITATLDNKALKLLAGDKQPSQVVKQLLLARAIADSGKPFAKNQKGTEALLKKYNRLVSAKVIKPARVTDEAGNVVSSHNISDIKTPEGYIVTQQSFLSRQKELGGMNVFIAVDPSNQKVYSMLSDGHDIFGKTPIGGNHLITASPIVVSSYKTGTKYNAKQIVSRKTDENVKAAVKRVEDVTGIKRQAGESADKHALRAMRESTVETTAEDAQAAKRAKQLVTSAQVGTAAGGVGAPAYMLTSGEDE